MIKRVKCLWEITESTRDVMIFLKGVNYDIREMNKVMRCRATRKTTNKWQVQYYTWKEITEKPFLQAIKESILNIRTTVMK